MQNLQITESINENPPHREHNLLSVFPSHLQQIFVTLSNLYPCGEHKLQSASIVVFSQEEQEDPFRQKFGQLEQLAELFRLQQLTQRFPMNIYSLHLLQSFLFRANLQLIQFELINPKSEQREQLQKSVRREQFVHVQTMYNSHKESKMFCLENYHINYNLSLQNRIQDTKYIELHFLSGSN